MTEVDDAKFNQFFNRYFELNSNSEGEELPFEDTSRTHY